MPDQGEGVDQQWASGPHLRRPLGPALAHHGADGEPGRPAVDAGEPGRPVEVDDVRRPGQAEVQERNQALAAGERPALVTVGRQQRHGLVE